MMNENVVDDISVVDKSIVDKSNVNKKEKNRMVFNHTVDLEHKKQGMSIDKVIDCCTKLGLDKS